MKGGRRRPVHGGPDGEEGIRLLAENMDRALLRLQQGAHGSKMKGTFVVSNVEVNAQGEHHFTMSGQRGGMTEGLIFVKTNSAESLQAWVNFIRNGLKEEEARKDATEYSKAPWCPCAW
jgi:hypothetical protein